MKKNINYDVTVKSNTVIQNFRGKLIEEVNLNRAISQEPQLPELNKYVLGNTSELSEFSNYLIFLVNEKTTVIPEDWTTEVTPITHINTIYEIVNLPPQAKALIDKFLTSTGATYQVRES